MCGDHPGNRSTLAFVMVTRGEKSWPELGPEPGIAIAEIDADEFSGAACCLRRARRGFAARRPSLAAGLTLAGFKNIIQNRRSGLLSHPVEPQSPTGCQQTACYKFFDGKLQSHSISYISWRVIRSGCKTRVPLSCQRIIGLAHCTS